MTKSTSVFLDVLRISAALIVFAAHVIDVIYPGAVWLPAHAAVIVFFVLSGYVIAFSTLDKKVITAKKYIIARLSRLYSVVIPALLLTLLLLVVGSSINPPYYARILRDYEYFRFIVNAFFLQSVWWRNLVPHDNGPFWSLGYEFWYYVVFGILIFAKNWRWKTILILACGLIVGENVILLFPLWLMGAGLYIYKDRFPLPRQAAAFAFAVMLVVTVCCIYLLPEYPGKVGVAPMFYAGSWVTDWILGLALGAVIWLYTRAFESFSYGESMERVVQWMAGHTFSLYLYHYPFILFFDAIDIFNPHVWWQAVLEMASILGCIVALSEVTESKRGLWKKAIERAWARWEPQAPLTTVKKAASPDLLAEP